MADIKMGKSAKYCFGSVIQRVACRAAVRFVSELTWVLGWFENDFFLSKIGKILKNGHF